MTPIRYILRLSCISLAVPMLFVKVINMTRAFGDKDMKSAGIIAIPEISLTNFGPKSIGASPVLGITQFNIPEGGRDSFLLLMSDGLDQVQDIVCLVQS